MGIETVISGNAVGTGITLQLVVGIRVAGSWVSDIWPMIQSNVAAY